MAAPLGAGLYKVAPAQPSFSFGSAPSYMAPQEEESWVRSLARNTGSAVEQLGLFLDTPGAITRGILAGDPMSGFNWDYEKRTSGEDLLKSYGLLGEGDQGYLGAAAGFATEVATDPLSWFTFPASALTKAGKAAREANLLDLAPIAAQSKMGLAAARDTMTGKAAQAALDNLLPRGATATAEDYAIRPLVGPRLARTQTTLDDVIQAAPDPRKALDDVTKYLDRKGLDYQSLRGETLGGAFGLGFMSPLATFTPPGSEKVLDALDAAGQAAKWSHPARLASSFFDTRVAGQIDAADQMAAIRQSNMLDAAQSQGRRLAAQHAETVTRVPLTDRAKTLLGADSLLSEQGNNFLTRLAEGKPTAADAALSREIPGIQGYVSSWDRIRTRNASEAQRLGLDFTPLQDPRFGVRYSPRGGTEFDFGEYGTGFGRSQFTSRVYEDMSRNAALFTPGGTTDLREVSRLPVVRQWAQQGQNSQQSVAQVGQVIADYINRKHGTRAIDQAQGEGIARVMYRLNKDLPANVSAFAGHPLNEQARVIISQEVARANANFVYDEMARYAVAQGANTIPGAGYKNLAQAANEIAGRVGLKTGSASLDPAVQQNLVDRISARLGIPASQIDLTKVAIPEQVYNRLSRIEDFYSSPRAQQEVSGMLDSITQMWKSFILAWPARHSRDMISNAITVWLETGSPLATTRGFGLAKQVLAGDIDGALPQLSQLPAFRGMSGPALKSAVYQEIAASGILTGLAQADVLTARRSGELSRLLPGVTPVSRLGALGELLPDGSRTVPQMVQDFGTIRGNMPFMNKFETRNPVLNASQKLTDANDSIARLGGWFALLSQGINPEQAAQRMQKALVNYESLTPFERGFMRKIFPWYSYTSRIGKYVVDSMLENPGGPYSQLVRGVNVASQENEGTYVPAWLRQRLSLRVPDEVMSALGVTQGDGNQTFLSLGGVLPGMDALSLLSPGDAGGTVRNLLAQSNPYMKGAAELAFGEDLFSKLPLEEADPAINKVYRGLTGGELSPTAKVLGSNIPGIQRLVGVAGSLMDDRYPMSVKAPKTAINNLLGVSAANVDERMRTADAMKQLNDQMSGFTKTFPRTVVDKEAIATAPPEIQRLAILRQIMEKRERDAKKAKKNQLPPVPLLP